MVPVAALLLLAHVTESAAMKPCASDLDCSLNGQCSTAGSCVCDKPWTGPACGVLAYKATPASGRNLYLSIDARNTWNGAIIRGPDGVFHLYNPIFAEGTLGGTRTMLHGVSSKVTGPYEWGVQPDIEIEELGAFNGPKSVVFNDSDTNKTIYSLWLGGGVYMSHSASGPFTKLENFSYPGNNPAPLYHNGAFYVTNSPCMTVYTTPRLVPGATWTKHGDIDHFGVPADWNPEDPHLWVDRRGNWHIVNHAYNPRSVNPLYPHQAHPNEYRDCARSVLSSHFFSKDGAVWHFHPDAIQPYSHTVQYDDGTSHMYVTMERPSMFFDEHGILTHIHLAADMITGDEGCGNRTLHQHFGHCPCDNCKYEDKGGTTIIALDA